MPVITFSYTDFIDILGYKISKEELTEKLPMIGGDLDKVEDDEISIEFFPDRPDLTSVEGVARASRAFFEFKTGLKRYEVEHSDIIVKVEESVKKVRPFIATALVKDVSMTDELISSLMELQEKLHLGLGRNRKKVAIGVHNFEPVEPPFVYKGANPNSEQFVPLNKIESMTLNQILEKHEKGIDYAHLLKDFDEHPLIVDKNNNVLSYPPIINGSLTEVTPFSTDLFIDVTGNDQKAINYALNIVVTALAERGGKIFSTTIIDGDEKIISPDLEPVKRDLSVDYVNRILGTSLNEKDIIQCLEKMGYNAFSNDKGLTVEIPSWRADILHEIDLVEDVSVGYGYDKFETDLPKSLTFGKSLPFNRIHKSIRDILIGLGFNEVTTFTISNEKDEFDKFGMEHSEHVELKNPISEDYTCMRIGLLPSLLRILNENRHHPLPQQLFEIGVVIKNKDYKNTYNLGFVEIDAKANFTLCKSYVEAILRGIGKRYEISEFQHPAFINGRCAEVIINENKVGYFGELHPQTITNFELEHPIIAFELSLDEVF